MDVKVEQAKWMALRHAMQELLHHPSWESYARQMEDEENRGIQSLVTCSKDEHDYWKGYITALRWAYHRPQKVIDLAERTAKDV